MPGAGDGMTGQISNSFRAQCRDCQRTTNHIAVHETRIDNGTFDDGGELESWAGSDFWQIIRCLGCDNHAFRLMTEHTCFFDDFEPQYEESIYPPVNIGHHQSQDYRSVPADVRRAYAETVAAYNGQMNLLASMGVRMAVEGICNCRNAVGHNLKTKIQWMVDHRFFTQNQADVLQALREHGNDSAHELYAPPARDVLASIQVLEAILRDFELSAQRDYFIAQRQRRRAQNENDA